MLYLVNTPEFPSIIGQGDMPTGVEFWEDGQLILRLNYGETIETDETIEEVSMEIAGAKLVRADFVERLIGENPNILSEIQIEE